MTFRGHESGSAGVGMPGLNSSPLFTGSGRWRPVFSPRCIASRTGGAVPPPHRLAAGTMESASKSDSLALKLYEACEKGNEGAVRRLARSIVSDMTQDVSAYPRRVPTHPAAAPLRRP